MERSLDINSSFLAAAAIGWSAINYPDLTVRAIAVAIVLMVGNIGSIIAAYLFRSTDAPRYGTFDNFTYLASKN